MIYTAQTRKAMNLMFLKHKDQLDKAGMPYVFHPWHVAESMEDEKSTCAALLHDIVEDTDMTLEELADMGFDPEVIEALSFLTHPDDVDYYDYIENLSQNEIAIKVKLSDLAHNSDLTRLPVVDEKARARYEKYQKCTAYLQTKLLEIYSNKEKQNEATNDIEITR